MNGSLSQKHGDFPPPLLNIYLGLVCSIISSIGGEPASSNSGEGNGTEESPVIAAGQSCEMNTSTNGRQVSADIGRVASDAGEETTVESNFETVRDVK